MSPDPIGSPTEVKTTGIVAVAACGTLAVAVPKPVTMTSGGFNEFGDELGQVLRLSFGGAEVENQILAFRIAEFFKALLEYQRILIANQGEVSDAV
jgi:hypothetical protein